MTTPLIVHGHYQRVGGISSGSIGEFKNSAPCNQLANVSITGTRLAGSMAFLDFSKLGQGLNAHRPGHEDLKLLENGITFKVRTKLKGFKKYVTKRGLIQNKGVYLDMSNDNEIFGVGDLGDHTLLSAKNSLNEPLSSRSFVNYWIAAPKASTDFWAMGGWDGDDFIQGTDAAMNEIHGFGGDDYLHGSANHRDILYGGDGDDKMYSYKADDTIFGDAGSDILSSGLGDDQLEGGDGNDSLFGAKGDDLLRGGPGDDLLMGGPGINTLSGGQGSDRFALLKSTENLILDFDPFEGDQLLIRSKDMAKLKIFPQGFKYILDFGQSTTKVSGDFLDEFIIKDAILLR
jgi:Ca2+-binding RTX toxin-like protein